MHALHIIHRDVKLENIFIGGAGELKLGDFGLTMSMKQETAISPVGTVEYMAPEVRGWTSCDDEKGVCDMSWRLKSAGLGDVLRPGALHACSEEPS